MKLLATGGSYVFSTSLQYNVVNCSLKFIIPFYFLLGYYFYVYKIAHLRNHWDPAQWRNLPAAGVTVIYPVEHSLPGTRGRGCCWFPVRLSAVGLSPGSRSPPHPPHPDHPPPRTRNLIGT